MQQAAPSAPVTGYPAPPYPNGGGGHYPNGVGGQYPYVAYPQEAGLYYHNDNNNNVATRSFFRAFIGSMICLVIVFAVIALITFLVLRPSLPSFQLNTLTLSDFNTSSQLLSATWQLSFVTLNRNKKISITYHALRSSIFYGNYFLTDAQFPPFVSDTMSQNTINATLSLSRTYVDPFVIRALNSDADRRHSTTFDVQLLASTSFYSGSWRFRSLLLKVLCQNIPITFSSNATSGNFIGAPKTCQVWN